MFLQIHISTVLIHSGLLFTPSWADIVFSDDSDDGGSRPGSQGCSTVGGPGAGSPCQFPFIYKEVSRDGCITEADPDGKAWCSTKVDSDGVHVTNGQHWAHCSQQCPLANIQQSSSASSASSSSAFTVNILTLRVSIQSLICAINDEYPWCLLACKIMNCCSGHPS